MLDKLKALAGELNQLMGLEPAIDATLPEENLAAAIKKEGKLLEAADENPTEGKPLTEDAIATLTELGIAVPWATDEGGSDVAIKKKAGGKKKAAKAAAKKKAPAKKAAPKKAAPVAAKKAVADNVPRYTRTSAFAEALRSGVKDVGKLAEKADTLYSKRSGKASDIVGAKFANDRSMAILIALELITVEKGKVTSVKF